MYRVRGSASPPTGLPSLCVPRKGRKAGEKIIFPFAFGLVVLSPVGKEGRWEEF